MTISQNAIDLILRFEIGGSKKYYDRYLSRPTWPGGASGVTIGIGYDLGYDKNIEEDWEHRLSEQDFSRLYRVRGLTGQRARTSISGVRDIVIPWEAAMDVFTSSTLPVYIQQTMDAFPCAEKLPPDAFGALVSVVFNRGPLIDKSDRRKEMRAIRNILLAGNDDIVDKQDIKDIASQVRSMARLWNDVKSSDGDLHDRRLAEADLIMSTIA